MSLDKEDPELRKLMVSILAMNHDSTTILPLHTFYSFVFLHFVADLSFNSIYLSTSHLDLPAALFLFQYCFLLHSAVMHVPFPN